MMCTGRDGYVCAAAPRRTCGAMASPRGQTQKSSADKFHLSSERCFFILRLPPAHETMAVCDEYFTRTV